MDRIGTNGAVTRYEPQVCTACGGQGGKSESEYDGVTLRQSWRLCTACNGSGKR